ncbi:MAG TPA: DEAD/DEAH box helicase [Humisphaera sp.]|jgi:ATP-dependent RNA helicase RhlE|nr:DEAD/DEAH box helicase [Humisphaera sp.]
MTFSELGLTESILRALAAENYQTATPIQAQAIPPILAGRDLLGCAQTGTGKTAAFALPIIQRLTAKNMNPGPRQVRALVLCPTRELASQIFDSFKTYGRNTNLRYTVIFGGVGQNPQVQSLRVGTDVLIATPGRLLDLINQSHVDLRAVQTLVLDEADRMLDMGFIHDIRRIITRLPAQRQSLLFSATMPNEIRSLADTILRQPEVLQVTPAASTVSTIEQSVYFVEKRNKPTLLAHVYNEMAMSRVIVFTRTKHGADKVVRHLHTRGIRAEAIHGNKSQGARQRALHNFKGGKTAVLVATDIASRGIDVDGISHVVNYDVSDEPETYVHRIGRTARAGASGAAISFCDPEEMSSFKAIERLIRRSISVKKDHPVYTQRIEQGQGGHRAQPARTKQSDHRSARPFNAPARPQPVSNPRQSSQSAPPRGQFGSRRPHPLGTNRPHHRSSRPVRHGGHSTF